MPNNCLKGQPHIARKRIPIEIIILTHVCFSSSSLYTRRAEMRTCLVRKMRFWPVKNPLLHICDLYDTALRLRVLWILHHCHVQFFLAFAEGNVCCAVTRGDLKHVQQLAVGTYLQNLATKPLGNINVTLA